MRKESSPQSAEEKDVYLLLIQVFKCKLDFKNTWFTAIQKKDGQIVFFSGLQVSYWKCIIDGVFIRCVLKWDI